MYKKKNIIMAYNSDADNGHNINSDWRWTKCNSY